MTITSFEDLHRLVAARARPTFDADEAEGVIGYMRDLGYRPAVGIDRDPGSLAFERTVPLSFEAWSATSTTAMCRLVEARIERHLALSVHVWYSVARQNVVIVGRLLQESERRAILQALSGR